MYSVHSYTQLPAIIILKKCIQKTCMPAETHLVRASVLKLVHAFSTRERERDQHPSLHPTRYVKKTQGQGPFLFSFIFNAACGAKEKEGDGGGERGTLTLMPFTRVLKTCAFILG